MAKKTLKKIFPWKAYFYFQNCTFPKISHVIMALIQDICSFVIVSHVFPLFEENSQISSNISLFVTIFTF